MAVSQMRTLKLKEGESDLPDTPNTEDLIAEVLQEAGNVAHRNVAIRLPPLGSVTSHS